MSHPNRPGDPNQGESASEPDMASDEVPGASDVTPVRLSLLPDAARELPVPGDNTTPQGDRRRAHWSDAAGGKRVMVTYVPEALDDEDPAIVTEVMRATRAWVAQAGPHDALSARQMMWAVAPMAAWLLLTLGSLDVTMLNHRNVEVWINHVNKPKQSDGWASAGARVPPTSRTEGEPRWRLATCRGDRSQPHSSALPAGNRGCLPASGRNPEAGEGSGRTLVGCRRGMRGCPKRCRTERCRNR